METLILYDINFTKKILGDEISTQYVTVLLPNGYDLFISLGISSNTSFESDFLKIYTDLVCYVFDERHTSLPESNADIFLIKNQSHNNNNTMFITNLEQFMDRYTNIFLRMDIEGAEYVILNAFIENGIIKKLKQFVVEIHTPNEINLHPDYFKDIFDLNITNETMFGLFNKINMTHTLVHFTPNNSCKIGSIDGIKLPYVFKLTYIRNDFIKDKIRNKHKLPSLLEKNISGNSEYNLSGFPYSTELNL
jgi:hypothetical protein